jgi:hypothetical protein
MIASRAKRSNFFSEDDSGYWLAQEREPQTIALYVAEGDSRFRLAQEREPQTIAL